MIQPVDRKTFEERTFPHMYDVMVYQRNGHYYAKDSSGKLICTDSQTACIQEAIDYVYNNWGGGLVFIKSGEYIITTPINIAYNAPIAVVGESPFRQTLTDYKGITHLKYVGPAGSSDNPVSVINGDAGRGMPGQYVLLKDLSIGLVGKQYPYTRVVNLNHVNKFWVERVFVYVEGAYGGATESYGFYTDSQGNNGGVMIDTFSMSFYAAYKLYVDHFVGIRMQALYSILGFWTHYAGSEIVLINPHALECSSVSFHLTLDAGGSVTLIEPYSEGAQTYDYTFSGKNMYAVLINPRASRTPPVVRFAYVDFSKISIVGGTIRLKNSGIETISAGSARTTVTHGMSDKPNKVLITPLAQPPGKLWVENITSTSFDIVTDTPPTSDLQVAWYAEV